MSARHLIGLRLIRWGERILNDVPQDGVDCLRCRHVHPQASRDGGLGRGVSVNDGLSERKIDSAVVLSGFAYQVDMGRNGVVARNHPSLISYLERVRFNPNVAGIAHQSSPLGNSVNAFSLDKYVSGVES